MIHPAVEGTISKCKMQRQGQTIKTAKWTKLPPIIFTSYYCTILIAKWVNFVIKSDTLPFVCFCLFFLPKFLWTGQRTGDFHLCSEDQASFSILNILILSLHITNGRLYLIHFNFIPILFSPFYVLIKRFNHCLHNWTSNIRCWRLFISFSFTFSYSTSFCVSNDLA